MEPAIQDPPVRPLVRRQRATGDARAAERARIAREIHDAISQHLFALRMIAAGMRRADPANQQAQAIERDRKSVV